MQRERLIEMLWPQHPSDAARRLLTEAIYVLRKEVDDSLFVTTGDQVALRPGVLRCDVVEFDEAVTAGDLRRAVALYQGPFLEGFVVENAGVEFDHWSEEQRARLARSFAGAAEGLAKGSEERGDWTTGAEWWRRVAKDDLCNSRVALRLMRALALAGDRAAAIRHADIYARLVREELEIEPDPGVAAYAEQLRTDPTVDPPPQIQLPAPVQPPSEKLDSNPPVAQPREPGIEMVLGPGGDMRQDVYADHRALGEAGTATPPPAPDTPLAMGVDVTREIGGAGPAAGAPEAGFETRVTTAGLDAPQGPPGDADAPAEADAVTRRQVTVWLAEVVGGTPSEALVGAEEPLREMLHEAAQREVRRSGGHPIESIGPVVLAEFAEARTAAVAALRLLRRFERRTRAAGTPATLRIGMHTGELATTPDGGIYGEAVTTASQLQDRAEPGQVLVTDAVRTRLRSVPGFRFAARGVMSLAGGEIAVFDLQMQRRERTRKPPVRTRPPAPPTETDIRERPEPPPSTAAPRPRARVAGAAALVLLVVGVAASVFIWRDDVSGSQAPLEPDRIAVLCAEEPDASTDLRYLCRGLQRQLIHQLARVDGLDVVSSTGVRPYRVGPVMPDSIARVLRAGTLVAITLDRSEDRIRMGVELIDATGGRDLTSEMLERPAGKRFALEDDLAREVSLLLRVQLGRTVSVQRAAAGTQSVEARDLVLRAEQLREDAETLARAATDPRDAPSVSGKLDQADSLLARAARLDPRWKRPPLLRGWVALDRADRARGRERAAHATGAAGWAERALRLAPGAPEALELRGSARWRLSRKAATVAEADSLLSLAEGDLKAAVDADPTCARALATLSQVLRFRGRFAEAALVAEQAHAADAYLVSAAEVADRRYRAALVQEQFPEAHRLCREGAAAFPGDYRFQECPLVLMALDPGTPPDPEAAWRRVVRLDSLESPGQAAANGHTYRPAFRRMMAAGVLARAGRHDDARAMLARARSAATAADREAASPDYDEARVWLLLGDEDRSLRLLERFVAINPLHRWYLERDPLFKPLHRNPRFHRLVR